MFKCAFKFCFLFNLNSYLPTTDVQEFLYQIGCRKLMCAFLEMVNTCALLLLLNDVPVLYKVWSSEVEREAMKFVNE